MRNIYKLLHVIALVSIYFCDGSSQLNAQAVRFTKSGVGEFPETPSEHAAIQFTSSNISDDEQTGAVELVGEREAGLFNINCMLPSIINTLGINMYPNPYFRQARTKFIRTAPLTETFHALVVRLARAILISSMEFGKNLFVGKSIDVSRFSLVPNTMNLKSTQNSGRV